MPIYMPPVPFFVLKLLHDFSTAIVYFSHFLCCSFFIALTMFYCYYPTAKSLLLRPNIVWVTKAQLAQTLMLVSTMYLNINCRLYNRLVNL